MIQEERTIAQYFAALNQGVSRQVPECSRAFSLFATVFGKSVIMPLSSRWRPSTVPIRNKRGSCYATPEWSCPANR